MHGADPAPDSLKPRLVRVDKARLDETRAIAVELASPSGETLPVVVIRSGEAAGACYTAFINRCTHARWPLDRFDGQFLFADDGTALICAAHFALFDPVTGDCLGGPGMGRALTPVALEVDGDNLLVGPVG